MGIKQLFSLCVLGGAAQLTGVWMVAHEGHGFLAVNIAISFAVMCSAYCFWLGRGWKSIAPLPKGAVKKGMETTFSDKQIEAVLQEFQIGEEDGVAVYDPKKAAVLILQERANVAQEKENHIHLIRQFSDMT